MANAPSLESPLQQEVSLLRHRVAALEATQAAQAQQPSPDSAAEVAHTLAELRTQLTRLEELHVQNTGRGIPAAQRARIFEPLYTTKPGGSGMGLYIVHEIVAAHAGLVTVESEEGRAQSLRLRCHA